MPSLPNLKAYCLSCGGFTALDDAGDSAHPACAVCHERQIEMRSDLPDLPPDPKPPKSSFQDEPLDTRPMLSRKRLPEEQRRLTFITQHGFYFCGDGLHSSPGCQEITRPVCPICESKEMARQGSEPAVFDVPQNMRKEQLCGVVKHFCSQCQAIVEPACSLCGAERILWIPPVCEPDKPLNHEPAHHSHSVSNGPVSPEAKGGSAAPL